MCDGNDLDQIRTDSVDDVVGESSQDESVRIRVADDRRPNLRLLRDGTQSSLEFRCEAVGSIRASLQIPLERIVGLVRGLAREVELTFRHSAERENGP